MSMSNFYNEIAPIYNIIIGLIIITSVSRAAYHCYFLYVTNRELILSNRVLEEQMIAQQNLSSEVTITPEDLRLNPELLEILEITDDNNPINLTLETINPNYNTALREYNQFIETIQAHHYIPNRIISIVEDISQFNAVEIITFLNQYIDLVFIYVQILILDFLIIQLRTIIYIASLLGY